MRVYIALCAEAFVESRDACERVTRLIAEGTRHQALVCAYFALSMCDSGFLRDAAKTLLLARPDDEELAAIIAPQYAYALNYASRSDPALDAYFADREEFVRLNLVLKRRLEALGNKSKRFEPCVFPWYSARLTPEHLALAIVQLALLFGDDADKDEALPLLKTVPASERQGCLEALLASLKRPAQYKALFEALGDRSEATRCAAFKIANALSADKLDFPAIEEQLRLKSADVRKNAISLLLKQDDAPLINCARRLYADKNPAKQCAACDLMLQAAKADRTPALKAELRELLKSKPQSVDAQALYESAREALRADGTLEAEALFRAEDEYVPDLSPIAETARYRDAYRLVFPDARPSEEAAMDELCASCAQAVSDLNRLDALIEAHKGETFTDCDGSEKLLGYANLPFAWQKTIDRYPFKAYWEQWYSETGGFVPLLRALTLCSRGYDVTNRVADRLLGAGFSRRPKFKHGACIYSICDYLFKVHFDADILCPALLWLGYLICERIGDAEFFSYEHHRESECIFYQRQIRELLGLLPSRKLGSEPLRFALRVALFRRYMRALKRAREESKDRKRRLYYEERIYFGAQIQD